MSILRSWLKRASVIVVLSCALCTYDEAFAGRRKLPTAPVPTAAMPDPAPGSVQEHAHTDDADGGLMERLGFTLRMYAYGMRRYIEDAVAATPGSSGRVSEASLDVFARQLRIATFAHAEYTWVEEGVTRSHEFIARSNRGLDRFILRGTTNLTAPGHSEATYLEDSPVLTILHEARPVAESRVVAVRAGGANRENDAEMKILQELMHRIRANPAMRGGVLTAYVTQQPCESCGPAMRYFARETGARVSVHYARRELAPDEETPLWRALRQARETSIAVLLARFAGLDAPSAGSLSPGGEP